jgi:hypothetical protein
MASARIEVEWLLFPVRMNTTPGSGTMDFRPSANVDGEPCFMCRGI